MPEIKHIELRKYCENPSGLAIYCLTAKPSFAPIDINLTFLSQDGWSASSDRLRFQVLREEQPRAKHRLAELIGSVPPHLMLRRYDREEDCLAAIRVFLDGSVEILSNEPNSRRGIFEAYSWRYRRRFIPKISLREPRSGLRIPARLRCLLAWWSVLSAGTRHTTFLLLSKGLWRRRARLFR